MSAKEPQFFLLSAREESVLKTMAGDLAAFLGDLPAEEADSALPRIAYTLQVGREQMDVRLAVPARSATELKDKLAQLANAAEPVGTNVKSGRALADDADMRELVKNWLAKGETRKLVDAWLTGCKVDWSALYGETAPRRINLPTYPFKLARYWITESRGAKAASQPQVEAAAPAKRANGHAEDEDRLMAPDDDDAPARNGDGRASANGHAKPNGLNGGRHLFSLPEALQEPERPAARAMPAREAFVEPQFAEPEPSVALAPEVEEVVPQSRALAARPAGREITLGELQDELGRGLARALFMDENDIDLDETFFELGVESVSGVEWIRELSQRYGVTVKVSAIYDSPTLRLFSEFLYDKLPESPNGLRLAAPAIIEGELLPEPALLEAPIVEELVVEASPPPPAKPAAAVEPMSQPSGALVETLLGDLAEILVVDRAFLDAEQSFEEIGLDVGASGQLARKIAARHGVSLSVAEIARIGSPRALAAQIQSRSPAGPAVEPATPPVRAQRDAASPPPAKTETAPPARRAAAAIDSGHYGLVLSEACHVEEAVMAPWQAPVPARGEVAIAVKASALNFADVMCVAGLYPTMPDYPFVAGMELAGVVTALGAGVAGISVGDEVVAVAGDKLGAHADTAVVPARHVVRKPRNLSFEEAASLPVAFLTMQAAFDTAAVRAGESVLIHTAAGGCGLMGIQLARLAGLRIYGSSGKHTKRWKLKLIGIDDTVDYNQAFDDKLRQWTDGRGVDVVVNTVAGNAIQRGLNALAPAGRYVELAVHALKTARKLDLSRLTDNQSIHSVDMRRAMLRGEGGGRLGEALARMVEMAEEGAIVPLVSRVYPRRFIAEALKCVSLGEHIGKVVVSHRSDESVNCEEACLERMVSQHAFAASAERAPRAAVKAPAKAPAPAASISRVPEGIAVIGMVGQFPMAPSTERFWENLVEGRYCVTGLPYERWSMKRPDDGESVLYPYSGIMEEADLFDPLFFAISPKEARFMDPQQRTFLQNCWSCIEEAGYAPSALSGTRCGVFAGCSGAGYGFGQIHETTTHVLMGHTNSILPARISYHLNLKGPCMAIDTACSSALVAIAEACTSLSFGGCDLALAGGVNVFASPIFSKMAQEGGMLSEDGRCFTFDNRANGFVPAEGVGVFLLKRLADAERDGDRIHGVIRAWGINHDGKTNGMTAPSVVSQTALEREVYERFAIDPETISYVEAHGTGTRLGDPIEVQGLTDAFRAFTEKKQFCAIGSVKSNIGHALGAAAAAGVLKVLLSLKHKQLPPSINFEKTNEEIAFEDSPFFVNATLRDWQPPKGVPRRAAVSSFSYNGTNAHVVIDEYQAPARALPREWPEAYAILISAKVDERLHAQAEQLLRYVERVRGENLSAPEEKARLRDLAFTLQTGRDEMVERLGFVVSSLDELAATLEDILDGGTPAGAVRGNVRAAKKALDREDRAQSARRAETIAQALARQDLAVLLTQWLEGAVIDWAKLYAAPAPQRTGLPTYPFVKKRYWFDDKEKAEAAPVRELPAKPAAEAPRKPAASALDQRFAALMGRLDQTSIAGAAK